MPSQVPKKIKLKKIVIAIFLTILIWVWADLAQDESFSLSNVTITMSNSRENLWISFSDKRSIQIEEIRLNGPASQIGELKRKLNDNTFNKEIFIDAQQQGLTTPGAIQSKVVDFLKTAVWVKQLGLTVESCKPEVVDVNVITLVQKDLTVQCFDEGGNLRKPASLEPQKVSMYVPEGWNGDKLTARVDLLSNQIELAKKNAVSQKPYIILSPGQRRESSSLVRIKMPTDGGELSEYTITTPTLTVAMSLYMRSRYNIEVTNLQDVLNSFTIKATADAKQAYESQKNALMTLYILDSDAEKVEEEKTRKVSYNFPEEFVRKGEIELKNSQDAAPAKFKLVSIAP